MSLQKGSGDMAKGDKITVHVRAGDALTNYSLEASQNGRTVEVAFERDGNVQWLVVSELTRGGTLVWEDRYKADEVVLVRRQIKGKEA